MMVDTHHLFYVSIAAETFPHYNIIQEKNSLFFPFAIGYDGVDGEHIRAVRSITTIGDERVGEVISLLKPEEDWRRKYHYGLYGHKLIAADGEVYTRYFIVVKNHFGVIVRFTNLHNYAGIYDGKVFVPITSDAESKLRYICMMLNYILIKRYDDFNIDHVFKINREALEQFFRDYATEQLPNGDYRGEQSIEKCVHAVTLFFRKLHRKFGGYMIIRDADLVYETKTLDRRGRLRVKKKPAFQVKGFSKQKGIFRELPTKAFQILLNLAFRYAPDIAFAICLQAFAGLRAGEVMNVRQEGSPLGNGLIFTRFEGVVRKIEIDLTREFPLRSDGVICGKIKRERIQCVYPPFLNTFCVAYEHHKRLLINRNFEAEYCPMFVNSKGMAMTYDDYARRFTALAENHFRAVLLECDDPELRIYGQLLYENRLTSHALRHWYSVQLVLYGEDIAQIQYWRGDENPESAFDYLQNKGDLVRELEHANDILSGVLMKRGETELSGLNEY